MLPNVIIPTDEQCDIISKNIHYYFNRYCADPHHQLSQALGLNRHDTKALLYTFLYKEDAWFPRIFRWESDRSGFFLKQLNLIGQARRDMMDAASDFADAREDKRFPQ